MFPSIPPSDENNYSFDPKIVNKFGTVNFDPNATKYRVSKEEFLYLRDKAIQNGGSYIKIAQTLWFIRHILILAWLALVVWRIIAIFLVASDYRGSAIIQLVIYFFVSLVVVIFIKFLGDYYAKQGCKGIKTFLNQQNNILYNKRGLHWKIHPACHFMQLSIDEDSRPNNYIAPVIGAGQDTEIKKGDLEANNESPGTVKIGIN